MTPLKDTWINKEKGIWNYGGANMHDVQTAYLSGNFKKVKDYLAQHQDLALYLNEKYKDINLFPIQAKKPALVEKPATPITTPVLSQLQAPIQQKLDMFTNDDIRNLGFRNYSGMLSAVRNQANSNNPFVKAMIGRYGSNFDKWDLSKIEGDLGVRGNYRSFGSGDFGDMSRSMASWIGQNNGTVDKRELLNRTGKDGVVYSNATTKNLFDKQTLKKPWELDLKLLVTPITSINQFKLGGIMYKYLQAASNDPMDLIAQLSTAFLQGNTKSGQLLVEILNNKEIGPLLIKAVQQGIKLQDLRATIIAQAILTLTLSNTRKARLGAKLNYIRLSIGECPEGEEVIYFKKGGEICKKCSSKKLQKGGKSDPIKNFKKKKVNKHQLGGTFKQAFDNAYGKLRYFTWNGKVYAAYKGDKATDLGFLGAIDNLLELANALKDYNAGSHLGWNPGANKTTAIKHNNNGNMQGVVNDVIITGRRISPRLKANNLRKLYFDLWTAYVKKWHPNMLGRFKNTMLNMGYKYNWNTGVYSKSGSSYRLNNGLLQTQNIYTGNWSNINNSDALPGMPANGLSKRLQK